MKQQNLVPLVDEFRLESIKSLGLPDDADGFFSGLLEIFFERVPVLLRELEIAILAGDEVCLENTAHALKGSSGNLGALRMMELSERLEWIGREKRLGAEAHSLLAALQRTFPETRDELVKHRCNPI